MRIDLNADVGESYGVWSIGHDDELLQMVSSANVACGAHAGDPLVMDRTVALCARLGVAVGAHPGYPDRDGFGRRDLDMTADELEVSIVAQVGALWAIARGRGVELTHVKPHGALYNRGARDEAVAKAVAQAVRKLGLDILLVGLAGSRGLDAARAAGLRVAREAFADRAYEPDGSLRSRRLPGAVLQDSEAVAAQAVSIATEGHARAVDGSWVAIRADTICLHGDTPDAPEFARVVRAALAESGVSVKALAAP